MAYFIPISQLNTQSILTYGDFFPLVTSGSSTILTTYKVNLKTLHDFLGLPQISSSWTTHSFSSSYAVSASFPPYPQISMSWAEQSISASYSVTASWAPSSTQIRQQSCSLAISKSFSSSYSITASWAPGTQAPFFVSMSWATQSISSSYSITASWAPGNITANSSPIVYINSPITVRALSNATITPATYIMYVVTQSLVPYRTGVIVSLLGNGTAGDAAFLYVSSSIMIKQLSHGIAHGASSSEFFVNIGTDNKIYIFYQQDGGTPSWGANVIGYY